MNKSPNAGRLPNHAIIKEVERCANRIVISLQALDGVELEAKIANQLWSLLDSVEEIQRMRQGASEGFQS